MFGLDQIYWVLINSFVAFLYLFIISKILGKKQIAQLEFIDYALGISLGSIAAEMSCSEKPFYHFLIAMSIFFLLALLVAHVGRKSSFLKSVLKGKPSTLIYNGKINYKEICKANIDINDLLSMLREKNYFDINDVAFAIFEPSGKLSVLPKSDKSPLIFEDLQNKNQPKEEAKLLHILIIDGKIIKKTIEKLGKDKIWLKKQLKIENKKQLKNIALAMFNENQNEFSVQYKQELN